MAGRISTVVTGDARVDDEILNKQRMAKFMEQNEKMYRDACKQIGPSR